MSRVQRVINSKATQSLKSSALILGKVTPRYKTPPTWLPGIRVLLAFYTPLLLGLAVGNPRMFLPVSIGAAIISFIDPLGSNAKRFAVLAVCTLGCAIAMALGSLVGTNPAFAIPFLVVAIFIADLAPAFGSAAMRGGFWIVTAALFGISGAGISEGFYSPVGILIGGAWAIFLSLVLFRNDKVRACRAFHPKTLALDGVDRHVVSFFKKLPRHLSLKTALGRNSARIAIAAGLALCYSYMFGRPSMVWAAAAAIAVLNPQAKNSSKHRGPLYIICTILGACAAIALVMLSASPVFIFLACVPLLFFASNMRSVDYGSWVVLYSAFTLALLFMSSGGPNQFIFDAKLIDAAVGVGIGLLISLVSLPKVERKRLTEELDRARLDIVKATKHEA